MRLITYKSTNYECKLICCFQPAETGSERASRQAIIPPLKGGMVVRLVSDFSACSGGEGR